MLTEFLSLSLSKWTKTKKQEKNIANAFSDIYSFISTAGIHYYFCGDASSGIVITSARIYTE